MLEKWLTKHLLNSSHQSAIAPKIRSWFAEWTVRNKCKRWDLCWSATLPWTIAGFLLLEIHRACLRGWDRRTDRRIGWKVWERTCACGQCQVRQGARHDTWDDNLFQGHKDAQSLSWATRVRVVKCDYAVCNSVRAVFVGVLFTLQLEVLLQATETCPNSEKITNRQDLEHAENSNCSSSTGFGHTLTTMTKLSAGFTATVCRTSNLFSGQRRSRILRGLQIVALFAAWAKSGRWLSGSWVPPSEFAVRIQIFAIWILSALRSLGDVRLQGDPVRTIWCGVLSTRCQTVTSCILHRRTILRVS